MLDAEARAKAELLQKQKQEEEQLEKLRKQKVVWHDNLQTFMIKADAEALRGAEKEDYIFYGVFSENSVPEKYLREAVELVLRENNSKAMTQLLTTHYEQRVMLLRSAMELIVEEKSMARVALMNKLSKESSKVEIDFENNKLEEEYAQKQSEAESNVKSRLEAVHSYQQEQLKGFHLNVVDSIIVVYSSNKNNLATQSEEFVDYRSKLRSLTSQFDNKLKDERSAIDKELKDEFSGQMQKLQSAIAESTRLAEEKIEKKKQEMMRQRQELEKKQVDESSELDNMEKRRILDSFEKEANAQPRPFSRRRRIRKPSSRSACRIKRRLLLTKEEQC